MVSIVQTTAFAAPPSAVWDLVTDTTAWPHYSPVRSVTIERPGFERPDGVGQIRALKTWAGTVREEVTELEPGQRVGYTLLSGAPVRDYRGTITVGPSGAGTEHRWEIQFDVVWYLRPLLALMARRTVRKTLQGLTRELASSS
jgi:carbon monoxide dehydrogenase subunit G